MDVGRSVDVGLCRSWSQEIMIFITASLSGKRYKKSVILWNRTMDHGTVSIGVPAKNPTCAR